MSERKTVRNSSVQCTRIGRGWMIARQERLCDYECENEYKNCFSRNNTLTGEVDLVGLEEMCRGLPDLQDHERCPYGSDEGSCHDQAG